MNDEKTRELERLLAERDGTIALQAIVGFTAIQLGLYGSYKLFKMILSKINK